MCELVCEEPYVAVLQNRALERACSHCFQGYGLALAKCSGCNSVSYCMNVICKPADARIHEVECRFLAPLKQAPSTLVRLLARMLIRKIKGDEESFIAFNGRTINDLCHRIDELRQNNDFIQGYRDVCRELVAYVSSDHLISSDELIIYYAKLKLNYFSVASFYNHGQAYALYLGMAGHDHSCDPQARVNFRNQMAVLRSHNSRADYSKQLTISYVPLTKPRSERRKMLLESHFFHCECSFCTDERKEGLAHSVRCLNCVKGVCELTDDTEQLYCNECGSPSNVLIEEARRANQECSETIQLLTEPDVKFVAMPRLLVAMEVYDRIERILSKRNYMMGTLATLLTKHLYDNSEYESVKKYAYAILHSFTDVPAIGFPVLDLIHSCTALADIHTTRDHRYGQLIKMLRAQLLLNYGSFQDAIRSQDCRLLKCYNEITAFNSVRETDNIPI